MPASDMIAIAGNASDARRGRYLVAGRGGIASAGEVLLQEPCTFAVLSDALTNQASTQQHRFCSMCLAPAQNAQKCQGCGVDVCAACLSSEDAGAYGRVQRACGFGEWK